MISIDSVLVKTAILLLLAAAGRVQATVRTVQELRDAVAKAAPGTTISVAAGDYEGGLYFAKVRGEKGKPVVIAGADPKKPPVFKGGGDGIHLSDIEHLELRDLVIEGATGNGLNIDDGGSYETPSHHLVLRGLTIRNIGGKGNQDGIKLSGIDDFRVENCKVEKWGGSGSAIDMVGCHRGVVEGCAFVHDGSGGNGVQTKGGCAEIAIRKSRFENAGSRSVNIGGSTGLEYFRPALKEPPHAEARDIRVEGCTFIGSDAPIAFVGVDGALVQYNTIYLPKRWAIRILQETTAKGFVACRKGTFTHNLVVFKSDQWSEGGVNVGPNTEPGTFAFEDNHWYCVDAPNRSAPKLPSVEKNGHTGDPMFRDAEKLDLRLKEGSPAAKHGAEALK